MNDAIIKKKSSNTNHIKNHVLYSLGSLLYWRDLDLFGEILLDLGKLFQAF